MKAKNLLLAAVLMYAGAASAQTKIGYNTPPTPANAGSWLELSNNPAGPFRGFLNPLVPLTTTTSWGLSGAPTVGMSVYNTAAGITSSNPAYPADGTGEYFWDGTGWVSKKGGAAIEPWYNVATLAGATANTQNIYQMGNVGIKTATPGSSFDIKGSLAAQYNITSSLAYSMLATDFYLSWNGAAAGTVTLPAALAIGSGNYKGRIYQIKNTTVAQTLTVAANGTEKLDDQGAAGVASLSLAPGEAVDIISTGATTGVTWDVVSHHATTTPAEPWYNVATNKGLLPTPKAFTKWAMLA